MTRQMSQSSKVGQDASLGFIASRHDGRTTALICSAHALMRKRQCMAGTDPKRTRQR